MLFKRRDKPSWLERVRVAMWPRRSWARSFRYIGKRVLRLSATPHAIAAGFAAGVLVSFTPFVGLHFIMAGVLAYFSKGNILASALGTAVGNPLTFPFIWTASYRVGQIILGGGNKPVPKIDLSEGVLAHSRDVLLPVLKPMLVGAVPLGIVAWVLFYFLIRFAVRSFQEARKKRLANGSGQKDANGASSSGVTADVDVR